MTTVKATLKLLRRKRAVALAEARFLESRGSLAAAKWEYGYVAATDHAISRLKMIQPQERSPK